MPRAEAVSCSLAESDGDCIVYVSGPGYVALAVPPESIPFIAGRLALTHGIGRYIGSFDPEKISDLAPFDLPFGSFAVKAKRFKGMMEEVDSQKLVRSGCPVLQEEQRGPEAPGHSRKDADERPGAPFH
jgi:tRNA (guanine10-N2)-dimethyltransferase